MKRRLSYVLGVATVATATLLATPQQALACGTSIGDFVWLDSNGNGIQDLGEPGINGIVVRISADHVNLERTVVTANKPGTSDAGYYEFPVLCNFDYTVSIDPASVPAGYQASPIGVGSDRAADSNNHSGTIVNVPVITEGVPPASDLSIDFGFTPACSGKIGDYVWSDWNNNGIVGIGEPPIVGAVVSLNSSSPVATDAAGKYLFSGLCAGTYKVCVQIPPGSQPSPAKTIWLHSLDSNGVSDGHGSSCAVVTLAGNSAVKPTIDFGFYYPVTQQPGTGTPGYWKNHSDAWPVQTLTIGGASYSKQQVLVWLESPDGDKSVTMFRSLVAAQLNVLAGNDGTCISSTITAGNAWLALVGRVGSKVKAASLAWKLGEPIHRTLDNYNNGMLCAPSRDE